MNKSYYELQLTTLQNELVGIVDNELIEQLNQKIYWHQQIIEAFDHLEIWLNAEQQLANSQSYSISTPSGMRSITRANLAEVLSQIYFWETRVSEIKDEISGNSRYNYSLAEF